MANRTREEMLKFIMAVEGDDEIKGLVKDLIKLGDSSDASAAKANALLAKIESLGKVSNNIQAFTKLKASLSEFGDKVTVANKKVTELEIKLANDPGSVGLQRQLNKSRDAAISLEKEQNKLTAELTRTSNALAKEGVDTAKLGTAFQDLQAKIGRAKNEAADFNRTASATSIETKGAGASINKLGSLSTGAASAVAGVAAQLATVAVTATAAAAAVTAIFFKDAADSAIEFDDALTEVQAVSGATGDALDRLKTAAEDGGAATKFSALEAAQGLTELARATGDADAAIAALTPTLNLAQAGGIGVADAATFITTTLTQFNLEADKAAFVADLFATEANTTSDTVAGLGNAMSYAAPLARQLGLSVEETVAIIGALADQGFRSDRAGTALRATFSALLDPADSFGVALRELGIESTNFNEIIEQLAAKGDAGRDAILKLDAAARPAILALVAAGTDGIGKLKESLAASADGAEKFSKIIGSSFSAAQERMSGSLDQARRDLVEPLLEPVIVELNKLAEALNTFAQSEDFKILKSELQELFAEAGLAFKDFLGEVDFQEVVANIRQFVVDAKVSLSEFREAIGGIVAAVETIGDGVTVTFNIIQAFIQGVAALVARTVGAIVGVFQAVSEPARKLNQLLGLNTEYFDEMSTAALIFNDAAAQNAAAGYENLGEAGAALVDLAGQADKGTAGAVKSTVAVAEAGDTATTSANNLAVASKESAAGIEKQADAAEAAAGKTEALATENEQAAARIKAAFSDLGLKTQAQLSAASDAAKRNFDTIRQAAADGKAATEDVRRAFVAYAQAAIAAAKDSEQSARDRVTAELKVQAAVLGLKDALGELGVAGGDAGRKIAAGASQASAALDQTSQSANAAADSGNNLSESNDGVTQSTEKAKDAQTSMAISLGETSQAFQDLLLNANKYATNLTSRQWSDAVTSATEQLQAQQKALSEAKSQLEKQNAQYDETEQRLVALRKQYTLLTDAELRGLIDVQQKLEKNLELEKQKTEQKREQGRTQSTVNRDSSSSSSQSSRSSNNAGAPKTYILKIEDDQGSFEMYGTGPTDELERFLGQLTQAKNVSTRR